MLEVYQRPYNPLYSVVCLDETSRQLIEETRPSLPVKPGENKKIDYEYRRNGVVDLLGYFIADQLQKLIQSITDASGVVCMCMYMCMCI
ncbi:MAG: hypothetical protein K2I00_00805 [Ruminococcus sp.]|nr:hypothetical protein [Ruminococcus sp.]